MTDADEYFDQVWDRELKGGVSLSEYSSFLAQDAENSIRAGAHIAAVLVCCAAIEAHLRFEGIAGNGLSELTRAADLAVDLKGNIDRVRVFRNSWVHVKLPEHDELLQSEPTSVNRDCEAMALLAFECMVRVICLNQFV